MADGLANIADVLTSTVGVITGNTILMTMFCGGLLIVGAKIFKRLKNASKS